MNEVLLREVQNFPSKVKSLLMSAEGDEHIDAIGEIKTAESGITSVRRRAGREVDDGDHGKDWEVKVGRTAVRSYNTMSLLQKIADARDMGMLETIGYLMNLKILKLTWQWTGLKEEIARNDITLVMAAHEIVDGDVADVGEVWKDDYPRYIRIEKETL